MSVNKGQKSRITAALIAIVAVIAIIAIIIRFEKTGHMTNLPGTEYEYNIEELMKVDPNLILYEETSEPFSTGFEHSYAMATDQKGLIYVAGDNGIGIFNETGEFKNRMKMNSQARCVTISDDGKIFVGTDENILVFNEQLERTDTFNTLNDKSMLTSLAVTENDLFAADAGNRIVLRYNMSGDIVEQIGGKDAGRNIEGFVVPSPYFDLAIASDGLLRVTNPGRHRIEAYTFDGDMEFSWGKPSSVIEGFCGCCNPVNFAILADGSFVTCEKGLARIKIYDSDGVFVGVVASPQELVEIEHISICSDPSQCQVGGFDVAVDNQQSILVLDTYKNLVRTFRKIEK